MRAESFSKRFWAKVQQDPDSCWDWSGRLDNLGYGRFDVQLPDDSRPKPHLAHRVAWFLVWGELPEVLDHVCHNDGRCEGGKCCHRRCCNPFHLRPSTITENAQASHLHPMHRTHCAKGHEYVPENTYWVGNSRRCKACDQSWKASGRDVRNERSKRKYAEARTKGLSPQEARGLR